MNRVTLLAAFAILAGCSQSPRAASYFEAHPDEMKRVIAQCAAGAERGGECDNAQLAKGHIDADARMALYKKSF